MFDDRIQPTGAPQQSRTRPDEPPVSILALASLVLALTAARIRAAVAPKVPEGYEDAKGFHFGSPRLKTRSRLLRHQMVATGAAAGLN